MRRRSAFTSVLLAALVALASSACDDIFGVGDESELRSAERRWAREGPISYSYVLRRGCFCLSDVTREVRIIVENRVVVSRRYVDTDETVPPAWEDSFPAMEGVFRIIHDAIESDADDVDAQYHSRLGHPITVSIDYIRNAIDDELQLFVSEVRAR